MVKDGPTRGLKRPRRETLKKNPKKMKEDPEEMIEEPIPEVEPLDSSLNESVESSSSDCRAEDNRWKKFCDTEFRRMLKDERESQKSTLLSKWESNRRKNIKRIKETSKNDTVGIHPSIALERITSRKLREPDEDTPAAIFKMDFQMQRNGAKITVIPTILPPSSKTPFTMIWKPTCKNIGAEDGKGLSYIPYISDKVIDNEIGFIEDLIEIHGNQNTTFLSMTDEKKLLILKCALEELQKEDPSIKSPSKEVFEAMNRVCGTSVDDLEDLWDNKDFKEEAKINPSIDDQKSIWPEERSLGLLGSHHSLFCPRCYVYDCKMHYLMYRPPAEHYILKRRLDIKRVPEDPCGEDCFLHVGFLRENLKMLFKKKKKSNMEAEFNGLADFVKSDEGIAQLDEEWTDSDLVLLKKMCPIYKGNFCIISKCLGNKTCLSVCKKSLKLGFDNDDSEFDPINFGITISSPDPKKKTTNNQQLKSQRKKSAAYKPLVLAMSKSKQAQINAHNHEPCDHPGQSCGPECNCVIQGNLCEKYCACITDECRNRALGCQCKAQCQTKACPCFMARRECDPDLCKTCEADLHKPDRRCQNVKIQRGERHHLLLAPSDVAGWGIYIKESVKKDDFISEYCGEIISQEEADRRGKLYDKFKCSFLFDLNSEFCCDATKIGNKIRFANHSQNPNCDARVMRVNGDHRIGIFAKRDIKRGEELFFDYRYNQNDSLKYVAIERL